MTYRVGERLFMTAVALVCLAVPVFGVVTIIQQNSWDARCHRAGGHNVPHFEGMVFMPAGKVLIPVSRYSDHCIVNGREVQV